MIRPLRYRLSNDAQRDLARIYLYLADQNNPAAGRRLIKALENKIKSLAASGNSGVPRNHLASGLRAFPCRGRCIYFRIVNEEMLVLRVLHGKQDVNPDVFEPDDED